MNTKMIIAIVLIVLGALGLLYQGITYTTRENAVDVGPLHVDVERQHTIPIAPIVGGAALIGGLALLFVGRRTAA